MDKMFDMMFEDYMVYRTSYAIDVANRTKLIDADYETISLLQAMWAREYWLNKVEGLK